MPASSDLAASNSSTDLYVSWSDYYQAIEKLAIAIHQSGWQFNQIVCLAMAMKAIAPEALSRFLGI